MKLFYLRFPGFKNKVLTFSYDDASVYDKKLVEIFNKYNLKCTFNVNSDLFEKEKSVWHLSKEDVISLYSNTQHEIATHGAKHLMSASTDLSVYLQDTIKDKVQLEEMFDRIIIGNAYPNGTFSDETVKALECAGIKYARTVCSTNNFDFPDNFLTWHPTCHHCSPEMNNLIEKFLADDNSVVVPTKLFYIWGHSFEFNNMNNWELIEDIAKKLSNHDDVYYATNGEIFEYVSAFKSLVYSSDGSRIYNPSSKDIYLNYYKKDIIIKSGETVKVEKIGY